jgi:hypothetical protein
MQSREWCALKKTACDVREIITELVVPYISWKTPVILCKFAIFVVLYVIGIFVVPLYIIVNYIAPVESVVLGIVFAVVYEGLFLSLSILYLVNYFECHDR